MPGGSANGWPKTPADHRDWTAGSYRRTHPAARGPSHQRGEAGTESNLSSRRLSRQPALRRRGHYAFHPHIHEQLLAMGQLMLFDELQHLHTGEPLQIEVARHHLSEELRRLRRNLLAALGHGMAHERGEFGRAGVLRQRPDKSFRTLTERLTGHVFTRQDYARECVARIEDMSRDLAKAVDLGGRTVVEIGELFHRRRGVLADGLPGTEKLLESNHLCIVWLWMDEKDLAAPPGRVPNRPLTHSRKRFGVLAISPHFLRHLQTCQRRFRVPIGRSRNRWS